MEESVQETTEASQGLAKETYEGTFSLTRYTKRDPMFI